MENIENHQDSVISVTIALNCTETNMTHVWYNAYLLYTINIEKITLKNIIFMTHSNQNDCNNLY